MKSASLDGASVWAIMAPDRPVRLGPPPTDIGLATGDPVLSLVHQHRPALVLLSPPPMPGEQGVERFFRPGTTFEPRRTREPQGQAGKCIRGTTDPAMPGMGASPYSAWFSDETGLLEEIRIDLTKTFADMLVAAAGQDFPGTPQTVDKAELLYAFSNIRLNEPAPCDNLRIQARGLDAQGRLCSSLARPAVHRCPHRPGSPGLRRTDARRR